MRLISAPADKIEVFSSCEHMYVSVCVCGGGYRNGGIEKSEFSGENL